MGTNSEDCIDLTHFVEFFIQWEEDIGSSSRNPQRHCLVVDQQERLVTTPRSKLRIDKVDVHNTFDASKRSSRKAPVDELGETNVGFNQYVYASIRFGKRAIGVCQYVREPWPY